MPLAAGLVHEHNLATENKVTRRSEFGGKNCAAAVGGGAHHDGRDACRLRGGRRSHCSCVVDRHHDRRGERRSSFPSFPLTFPTMCPNANCQSPLWAKTLTHIPRGGARSRHAPTTPRLASAKTHSPHTPRAPCWNVIFARGTNCRRTSEACRRTSGMLNCT